MSGPAGSTSAVAVLCINRCQALSRALSRVDRADLERQLRGHAMPATAEAQRELSAEVDEGPILAKRDGVGVVLRVRTVVAALVPVLIAQPGEQPERAVFEVERTPRPACGHAEVGSERVDRGVDQPTRREDGQRADARRVSEIRQRWACAMAPLQLQERVIVMSSSRMPKPVLVFASTVSKSK